MSVTLCPKCGSTRLFLVPHTIGTPTKKCKDCAYSGPMQQVHDEEFREAQASIKRKSGF